MTTSATISTRPNPSPVKPSSNSASFKPEPKALVLPARQWLERARRRGPASDEDLLVGSAENKLIKLGTKNIILAPEKSFKTTFSMRQIFAHTSGETIFPAMDVLRRPRRIFYHHGEMSDSDIESRTEAMIRGFGDAAVARGLDNFVQARMFTRI